MYMGKSEFCSNEELQAFMKSDGNRLVWMFIHKYGKTLDRDEAYQESLIAVAKALAMYREDHVDTKKTTFVSQAVYNQIKMMLRTDSTQKREIEKASISSDELPTLQTLTNTEDDVLEKIDKNDRAKSLYAAIKHTDLSYEECYSIMAYLHERNQKDTASELGCSQSHISKKLKSAMLKIRECMENAGWDGHKAYFFDMT